MPNEILSEIKVLSLEQATVLPYLTYRLAQDGAQVIRLENPQFPDPNRQVGDRVLDEELMNAYFLAINAGKKAITLNLKAAEGQELLRKLIQRLKIDIFATNLLPRSYKKLGIDYETLREVKPDLIWVGITGFGPESNEAAYEPVLEARSGLMEVTGEPDGPPEVVGIPLSDMGTAEHAYGQVMKALFHRERTGEGYRIDLCMFQSSTSWLTQAITMTASFGREMTRRGNTHEFFAPVSVYKTADGYVYIAVGNDRQWEDLTRLPGFEGLAREEYRKNAGRIADKENLNRKLEEITRQRTTDELMRLFQEARIPISRVNRIREVIEDPLVREKLLYAEDPRSGLRITLAPPPVDTPFLQSVGRRLSFPPRLGEHNQEIFGQVLGLSESELEELKARGII
ncbi:MAG: CoA transferase [Chloroflexi bacterium]|nr:MAG: CoA transferase [Chloroflexota bacterium]